MPSGISRNDAADGDMNTAKHFEDYFSNRGINTRFFVVAGVNQGRTGTDIVHKPPYAEFDSDGVLSYYNVKNPDKYDSYKSFSHKQPYELSQ